MNARTLARMTWPGVGLAAALTLALAASAAAAEMVYRLGDLVVAAPWTRATPGGAKVAGGYVRITNGGSVADRLVGGEFALAGRVEVHEMATDGGVMRMRPLEAGVTIAPGATVELKPGGLHFMFMNLAGPVKAGQPVRGALLFEKAGRLEVEFAAEPIGARGPGGAHGH